MQSLSDEERREVLGEVLADELKAIHEYVRDIPLIFARLDKIDARLDSVENVTQMHEADIAYLRKEIG